eukprot:TRINITY_DN553_c0_g1_i9.p2 TRINITY_DN553_c0_g1~~TRINITY_DN553_c0_g1_i9.p2  ORF type:complete len:294 (+),score=93.43 TRINITY_DN553_c0_g1_i9:811-1692(+)
MTHTYVLGECLRGQYKLECGSSDAEIKVITGSCTSSSSTPTIQTNVCHSLSSNTRVNVPAGTCSGHVIEDPHFVGLQGERYDVMGEPEKWFNIVSDKDFMMNAFYHQNTNHLRGRTIMQQVAIAVSGGGGMSHTILANTTDLYIDNNEAMVVGSKISLTSSSVDKYNNNQTSSSSSSSSSSTLLAVSRISKVQWEIRTSSYVVILHHQHVHDQPYWDMDVSLLDKTRTPHGLLGQTAHHVHNHDDGAGDDGERRRPLKGKQGQGEIEGTYKDYEVVGPYGVDFIFNKFLIGSN